MAEQTARNWSSGDIVTAANLSSIERGVSTLAEEYTPTTWANGNTVTAAALNNIEQGIASAEGGGSSDFSTAQVTISNETGTMIEAIYIQNMVEENALGAGSPAGVINAVSNVVSTASIQVPLYKGGAIWQVGYELIDYRVSVSGSVTLLVDSLYYITGDCTITIS